MTEVFNFGNPANPDNSDGGQVYVFGCEWQSSVAGSCIGGRWRRPTNAPTGNLYMLLYEKDNTTPLASKLFTLPAAGDNDILFDTPVAILPNTRYISAVLANRYAFTLGGWPFTSGPDSYMTAPSGVNGRLVTTTANTPTYPTNIHGSAANFFIGPLFDGAEPSLVDLTPAAVTLSAPAVTATPGMVTVALTHTGVELTALPVTALPGMVTAALTAAALTVEAQPVTATPGMVTVALTHADLTLGALPLFRVPTGYRRATSRTATVAVSSRAHFPRTGGG